MNDAQRKAMEQAIDALSAAKNGLCWYRGECPDLVNESDSEADIEIDEVIAALRAQLDAPAGKGAPVAWAWRAKCPTTGEAVGPFFPCTEDGAKRAADCGYEVRAYAAPPTAAQIADEAIEKCAKVCDAADKSMHPADLADAIRALKSSATPTEGEKG